MDPETYEVIVVNDSGGMLDRADWLESSRVTVVNTNRCERSAARNIGAAVASGKYLHFLDDDDYLLPGALKTLLGVAEPSPCCWVYGGYRCVDDDGLLICEIRPEVRGNLFAHLVAGESLPFGASLVSREAFFHVGGFDPGFCTTEDRELGRRLALLGEVDRTRELVTCFRVGARGGTTDLSRKPEEDRLGREKALDAPGALARMRDSVQGDVYLRGRGCRAYLASAVLNIKSGRFCVGVSRLFACSCLAGLHLLHPDLWREMRHRVGSENR